MIGRRAPPACSATVPGLRRPSGLRRGRRRGRPPRVGGPGVGLRRRHRHIVASAEPENGATRRPCSPRVRRGGLRACPSRLSPTSAAPVAGNRVGRCHAQGASRPLPPATVPQSRRPSAPPRSSARRSVSVRANRQLRIWPSAVSRVRSQAPQNGRVTEPITPTVHGPPSTSHRSAGADPRSSVWACRRNSSASRLRISSAVTMRVRSQICPASNGICSMNRRW